MNTNNIDYKALLEFASKNEDGLKELLNTIEPYVMNKAYYYLGSKQDAEDIFQSVSVKLYENLNSIYPETFKAYLKTITTNACRDVLRKQHKLTDDGYEINTVELDAYQDWDIPSDDKGIDLTDEYRKQIVHEIINSLPDKQREVITLRYIDGMSVKDISVHLNIPESTIKSRLAVAYKQIEEKVLQVQERDDIKLYSYSPVLYFLLLLFKDSSDTKTNYQLVNKTMDNITRRPVTPNTNMPSSNITPATNTGGNVYGAANNNPANYYNPNINTVSQSIGNTTGLAANIGSQASVIASSSAVKAGLVSSIVKVLTGVLITGVIGASVYFAADKLIFNNNNRKDKDDDYEEISEVVDDNKTDTDQTDNNLNNNILNNDVSANIDMNNFFGLTALNFGVDEYGNTRIYRGNVDCGSNYLNSNATYNDVKKLMNSGCKISVAENQGGAGFYDGGNIAGFQAYYANLEFSNNNNDIDVIFDDDIHFRYDSSVGKYYIIEILDQFGNLTKYDKKVYFDDNLLNLLLFEGHSPVTFHNLVEIGDYQFDSNGNIVSFNKLLYDKYQIINIKYENNKVSEATIIGYGSDGTRVDYWQGKCMVRGKGDGTYRFFYDDLGLLRNVGFVRNDGKIEIIYAFYYEPLDPGIELNDACEP